ncbi:MAG: hypothetical protein WBA77_13560 [Microcoleaceae cyanobacterium]
MVIPKLSLVGGLEMPAIANLSGLFIAIQYSVSTPEISQQQFLRI